MAVTRTALIYERLKRELLEGVHAPDSKLAIDALCTSFGASPGAVREALSRLTSDRLVIAQPQRGFVVAPVSAEDLIDLTSVRIEIETRCLKRAIRLGDLGWEGRLLGTWHQLSRTPNVMIEAKTVNPDWVRLHTRFHDDLVAACDSHWWLRLRDELFIQAERYRRMILPYARVERDVYAEHQELLEETLARRSDRACEILAYHFQRTADILLASGVPFADMPKADGVRNEARSRRLAASVN